MTAVWHTVEAERAYLHASQRRWNELQNMTRDIQLLSEYLRAEYVMRVWSAPLGEGEAS
jgi:hypothetical protein